MGNYFFTAKNALNSVWHKIGKSKSVYLKIKVKI
jgi:hypothetical protein